ncbi:AAA family ATPase [Thermodesulfobacteriota bacterium]
MAVITVSRQFGSGARTIGKMIADELEYIFADSDIIRRIAEAANVSPNFVDTVEKEAGTSVSKVITRMVSKGLVDRVLKGEQGYIDERLYLDYLVVIIAQIAEEGNAVILGRGSQYILNDHPDAFHVLLIDNFENRVKFIQGHYNLSEKRATQIVSNEDKRRMNLYRKLRKSDYDNPALYHLVLNMGRIDLQKAVKMVLDLVNL